MLEGTIIREGAFLTEPAAFHQWLTAAGLSMERVGIEAGGLTPWLYHELLDPRVADDLRRNAPCQKQRSS
jgi:hypothetical protein